MNGLGPNGLSLEALGVTAIGLITPRRDDADVRVQGLVRGRHRLGLRVHEVLRPLRLRLSHGHRLPRLDGQDRAWTGQYGLAMTSLGTIVNDPVLGEVRGRMTQDEGRGVSGCLLAHVNTKGTHQYLSVRPYGHRVPSAQAAIALATTAGGEVDLCRDVRRVLRRLLRRRLTGPARAGEVRVLQRDGQLVPEEGRECAGANL